MPSELFHNPEIHGVDILVENQRLVQVLRGVARNSWMPAPWQEFLLPGIPAGIYRFLRRHSGIPDHCRNSFVPGRNSCCRNSGFPVRHQFCILKNSELCRKIFLPGIPDRNSGQEFYRHSCATVSPSTSKACNFEPGPCSLCFDPVQSCTWLRCACRWIATHSKSSCQLQVMKPQ